MTEIIDLLKKYTDGKQNTEKVEMSVLQLNRVVKALEQEPSTDAVSRQYLFDNCVVDKVTMPYVPISKIQEAPSVKPQEPRWIPVSERLPDKEGQYLVTVQSPSFGGKYMELANFSLDLSNVSGLFKHEKGRSGWWGRDDGGWNIFIYSCVIAWMPLPQSYKAESEES